VLSSLWSSGHLIVWKTKILKKNLEGRPVAHPGRRRIVYDGYLTKGGTGRRPPGGRPLSLKPARSPNFSRLHKILRGRSLFDSIVKRDEEIFAPFWREARFMSVLISEDKTEILG
jgi:hypothetical protein